MAILRDQPGFLAVGGHCHSRLIHMFSFVDSGVRAIRLVTFGMHFGIELAVSLHRTFVSTLAVTPVAVPVVTGIIEVGVAGNLQRETGRARRSKSPLAGPTGTVCGTRKVSMLWHDYRDTGLAGLSKAPLALPAGADRGIREVTILRHFYCDTGHPVLAKSSVAFPAIAKGIQECVLGYSDFIAALGHLSISPVTFPAIPICFLLGILRDARAGASGKYRARVDHEHGKNNHGKHE